METPISVYDVCRHYITDNAQWLGADYNRVLGFVRSRDYQRLANLRSEVSCHRNTTDSFRVVRQIEAFFSKNADFADEQTCSDAAKSSFLRGEKICRIANKRLDHYYTQPDRLDPDLRELISRSQRFISETLGDADAFLALLPRLIRLTPGAASTLPRTHSRPYMKMARSVTCTVDAYPYVQALYSCFGYIPPKAKFTAANRVEVVPKSWKTHRTIACEPVGNLPFQLAFDHYVKAQLRLKTRVDLSRQDRNQRHAYEGSKDGSFATIDLSMASDTLGYNCVAWLIPHDWFTYLCRFRSSHYFFGKTDEVVQKYAKFSSMGNGATFALETLIFYSFIVASGSKRGVAYGDDLTIEPACLPNLLRLLRFFGFVINDDKSYSRGPYRESCGHEYLTGVDVTPFYVRTSAGWDKPNLCHVVNGLARISSPFGHLWAYLRKAVEANPRTFPFVPFNHSTTSGLMIHPTHAYKLKLIRLKWSVYDQVPGFKAFVPKARSMKVADSRTLALWHHAKLQRPWSIPETTSDSASTGKFQRKWVCWNFPTPGAPDHMYLWSDYLIRES